MWSPTTPSAAGTRQTHDHHCTGGFTDSSAAAAAAVPARYMLVYFGFTFCPDICPAELAKVTKMLKILGNTSRPKPPLLPRYPLPVLIFTSVHWAFLLWCQQRKRKGSHLVWLSQSSSPLIPTATPLARSGAI